MHSWTLYPIMSRLLTQHASIPSAPGSLTRTHALPSTSIPLITHHLHSISITVRTQAVDKFSYSVGDYGQHQLQELKQPTTAWVQKQHTKELATAPANLTQINIASYLYLWGGGLQRRPVVQPIDILHRGAAHRHLISWCSPPHPFSPPGDRPGTVLGAGDLPGCFGPSVVVCTRVSTSM